MYNRYIHIYKHLYLFLSLSLSLSLSPISEYNSLLLLYFLIYNILAQDLGIDVDDLLVSQPDCGEMALDIVDKLVRSSAVDVIVVDSVAALVPRYVTF
jgi:hypothetical protein